MGRIAKLLILSALFALLGAAALAADTPGVTDTQITIGQWGPQTGPASPWGAVARGTAMYFKMVNDEGGIHGRKIKYLMFDDMYNPANTIDGVKRLVESEGVFAFVGGVGTAPGLAVMDYLIEHNIPWVSPSTGSTHWAFPPKRLVFATYPNYEDEAWILIKYAVEDMKAKRIAMIYQNDDYGKGGLEGANKKLSAYGMKLVAAVPVEATERDMRSHILKVKQAEPDVVIMFVGPTHAVIALKTAAAMKFNPRWMSTSTLSDVPMMLNITGGLWNGVIFTAFGELPDSNEPLMVKYREAFKQYATKGERWGAFFYSGIGYAEPMVEAMRRAGRNLTVDSFVAAMESLKDWRGILSETTFGPNVRQGCRQMFLAEAQADGSAKRLSAWIEAGD